MVIGFAYFGVIVMKQVNFERLSTDDLWTLHAKVSEVLGQRIQQEKLLLEERLRQLRVRESDDFRIRRRARAQVGAN